MSHFHVSVSYTVYSSSSMLKFKYVHLWKHTISKSIHMIMVLDVLNTVAVSLFTRWGVTGGVTARCHIRCHISVGVTFHVYVPFAV